MAAVRDRLVNSIGWRFAQMRRHVVDRAAAAQYGLQRHTGSLLRAEGHVPLGSKLAIYAIFPKHGLLGSHLMALRSLRACGYAPLVVSNLPLAQAARDALAPLVWQIIERPNFGLDFGAYREGMRAVEHCLSKLERLILLNDSVWFPLPGGEDWPLRAEALGVDLAGAISNCGVSGAPLQLLDAASWRIDPRLADFHYCSFALSLGPSVLAHPAFRRFWDELRLTDSKFHIVRRGEVGLSRCLINAGLSHAETSGLGTLGGILSAMSRAEVLDFMSELVIPSDCALEEARQSLLAAPGAEPREALLSMALAIVALTGPAYVFPAFAHDVLRHPFLKKSPLWQQPAGAQATLRLTRRLPGEDGALIHAEAQALVQSHRIAEPA